MRGHYLTNSEFERDVLWLDLDGFSACCCFPEIHVEYFGEGVDGIDDLICLTAGPVRSGAALEGIVVGLLIASWQWRTVITGVILKKHCKEYVNVTCVVLISAFLLICSILYSRLLDAPAL